MPLSRPRRLSVCLFPRSSSSLVLCLPLIRAVAPVSPPVSTAPVFFFFFFIPSSARTSLLLSPFHPLSARRHSAKSRHRHADTLPRTRLCTLEVRARGGLCGFCSEEKRRLLRVLYFFFLSSRRFSFPFFDRSLLSFVFFRIKRFSEWGVCTVLNLIATYKPQEEEEIFDIMNILDEKLKSSSSAVVLVSSLSLLFCSFLFLLSTSTSRFLFSRSFARFLPEPLG